ncbi:MAG: phenylalanine--tRNA ligase beta subunit-related protein [Thermoleophilaceae bacterium]
MAAAGVVHGDVDPQLAAELPGLAVVSLRVEGRAGRAPKPVREQLHALASRITAAKVVESRRAGVPWTYRVLWRRLGVDPDVDRTPVEALMLDRLRDGGISSRGVAADAAALATLETGVPVLVLDAAAVHGRLRLRPAGRDEALAGEPARPLRPGEAVYADSTRPLARIAGQVAHDCLPGRDTTAMLVCAIAAPTVPALALEEALVTAADALRGDAARGSGGP